MKSKLLIIVSLYLFSFSQVKAQGVNVSVGFQTFYDQLSPYGTWVNYPQYGYVWRYRPASGEFRPYSTNGRWVYTDDGWTWVSDYDWGWAPFHYGRWLYDDGLGWLWVPGNEWAPAWVTWGSYNDNFAWAPIGPGISISFSNNSYRPPANYWTVVPGSYFGRSDWHDHAIRNADRVTIVNKVTIINNYNRPGNGRTGPAYYRGPDTKAVERYTKAPVRPVRITEAPKPGSNRVQNDRVAFYRPKVNDDRRNAKPAKPADAAQLRREAPQNGRPQDPNRGRPATPAQPVKSGTPASVPPQQRPGNRQSPPRGTAPQQPTPGTLVNRPTDRRAEESKKEYDRAVHNRPATPATTPVTPAPVNPSTDRRPESGKNRPQRPEPTKPTPAQPVAPAPNKPVQQRPQRPAPAQPRTTPQKPVTPTPAPRPAPQPRPVQQQPRPAVQPHPAQPLPNRPVNQPQRPAPQPRPAEVKPPPHGN